MDNIKIDPEFQSLIQPLTNEEYNQLEENLINEGCLDTIKLWKGIILDGHNRYDICNKHNISFHTVDIILDNREEAIDWIIDNQLGRRNLTPEQQSYLRGKKFNQIKKNKGDSNRFYAKPHFEALGKTSNTLAKEYNVTHATIERDAKFAQSIDTIAKNTSPEIRQKILNRESPLPKNAVIAIAKETPEEQQRLISLDNKTAIVAEARKIAKQQKFERQQEILQKRLKIAEKANEVPDNEKYNIEVADIRNYQTDKQYDFIITDPPYPKEYLDLYETLALKSKDWLKPDGLLIVMCGQSYLNQIVFMLDQYLTYYWTACYLTPGQPTPLRHRQVNTTWKPLLIYGLNKNYKGKIFGDVFKSDGNDKSFHKWGQSVSGMKSIISQICIPGQIIFDPFLGAGTTGVAALQHGCLFDGIDIDENNIKISKVRLNDYKEI